MLRWPLHPQPEPLEALSSWLARIADLYGLSVAELLTGNLDLVGLTVPDDLDQDPPAAMLAALADRTGVDLARIRAATLAGWRPWLLDTLDAPDRQASFDNYVRAHSVLLAPRVGVGNGLSRYRFWRGPWLPRYRHNRVCPVCAGLPGRGRGLLGRLPLMVSCGEHGCRLEDATTVDVEMALHNRPPAPVPVDEPLAALDRYTYQALLTGRVILPGREVHAGVWFRLLRTLLHEVSLSPSTAGGPGGRTLELIWQTAGHPVRAGLGTWQPYEQMPWPTQERMLEAAAVALQLAANGRIIARGVLGSAVQPPRRARSTPVTRWRRTAPPGRTSPPRPRSRSTKPAPTPTPPGNFSVCSPWAATAGRSTNAKSPSCTTPESQPASSPIPPNWTGASPWRRRTELLSRRRQLDAGSCRPCRG